MGRAQRPAGLTRGRFSPRRCRVGGGRGSLTDELASLGNGPSVGDTHGMAKTQMKMLHKPYAALEAGFFLRQMHKLFIPGKRDIMLQVQKLQKKVLGFSLQYLSELQKPNNGWLKRRTVSQSYNFYILRKKRKKRTPLHSVIHAVLWPGGDRRRWKKVNWLDM